MFFKERKEREIKGEREEEEEVRHGTALVSPLKQILVILALVKVVIYKILEKTLILEGGINTLLDKCTDYLSDLQDP
jgi:hypothetical protein